MPEQVFFSHYLLCLTQLLQTHYIECDPQQKREELHAIFVVSVYRFRQQLEVLQKALNVIVILVVVQYVVGFRLEDLFQLLVQVIAISRQENACALGAADIALLLPKIAA